MNIYYHNTFRRFWQYLFAKKPREFEIYAIFRSESGIFPEGFLIFPDYSFTDGSLANSAPNGNSATQ